MTDQERRHVTDLLAAHDALIHWCETLITAHADLVELASEADLLNLVETDEHEQRLTQTRGVIEARFGKDSVPARPRTYQSNVRGAQEAHEAIRPTSFARDPESLRDSLQRDQWNLYQLVWQRAIASQMADARFDQTSVDIAARDTPSGRTYLLRATGSIMTFAGLMFSSFSSRERTWSRYSFLIDPISAIATASTVMMTAVLVSSLMTSAFAYNGSFTSRTSRLEMSTFAAPAHSSPAAAEFT